MQVTGYYSESKLTALHRVAYRGLQGTDAALSRLVTASTVHDLDKTDVKVAALIRRRDGRTKNESASFGVKQLKRNVRK
jgi:hypothetical protein